MKLFSKLMIFMVVAALAGPFIMKGPNGQPMMSLKDLGLPSFSLPKAPPKPIQELSGNDQDAWISWEKDKPKSSSPKVYVIDPNDPQTQTAQSKPGVFYRWKDANGVWQFSTKPNPTTANIVIETDPNANIVQSLSNDKIDTALGRVKETVIEAPKGPDIDTESSIPLPTTIPITEVPELIDQAKAVQDLVNKRTEMLERAQF